MKALALFTTLSLAAVTVLPVHAQTALDSGNLNAAPSAGKMSLRGYVLRVESTGAIVRASRQEGSSGYKAVEGVVVVRGASGAPGSQIRHHVVPDGIVKTESRGELPAYRIAGDRAVLTQPSTATLPKSTTATPAPSSLTGTALDTKPHSQAGRRKLKGGE